MNNYFASRTLCAGQIYKHFKGNVYEIICIAKDSNTLEDVVVYRDIENDKITWVRSMEEFLSNVDKDKYPGAEQNYRFSYVGDKF